VAPNAAVDGTLADMSKAINKIFLANILPPEKIPLLRLASLAIAL
jgi:hypothetical protein